MGRYPIVLCTKPRPNAAARLKLSARKWRHTGCTFLCNFTAALLLSVPIMLPPGAQAGGALPGQTAERRLEPGRVTAGLSSVPPLWPHESSDLHPDPALVYGRFTNGFRYVLMPNSEPRERVSLHLNVQAGSLHEKDQERGLAHFLEHLLFCGSTHFPPGELVKYFQRIGMQFGPDANAHTGFQETVYDILLPEGKPEDLENGLLVLSDYAQGALLLPAEIDRERKVIVSEMRARDSTSYRILDASFQFEFDDTLIARRLPIGQAEVIQNAGPQDLKNFYDTWYRPENMILVIVGEVDRQVVEPLLERYFSKLTARAPSGPAPEVGTLVHTGVKSFFHYEKEAGKTTVALETLRQKNARPDSFAFQRQLIVRDIADQIVQNRLDRMIAKGTAPCTSARIGSGPYLLQYDYAELSAECRADLWAPTLAFLEQTLRQARVFGFTATELERVKADYLANLDVAVSKAATRDSQNLAREIIWHLNNARVFQSPQQRQQLLQPIVASLTREDVQNAFKQVWEDDHRLLLVTGNAEAATAGQAPTTTILETYRQSGQKAVSKPEEPGAAVFPYLPEPPGPGQIVAQVTHPDLDIVQIRFANGVYFNYKPTDFKANEIQATLSFGSGRMSQPPSQPGLAELSEAVINASGLGGLDKEALDQALAGSNTQVSFSVDEDSFKFKGQTVSKNLELLFQLLYAYVQDPGYRAEAYDLALKRLSQQYAAYIGSVEGTLKVQGFRFLAGGDERFGFPNPSELERVKLDAIRAWVGDALAKTPLEISLVGDFDRHAVSALAARYFGSLKTRPAWPDYQPLERPLFPEGQKLSRAVATQIPKGLIMVAYLTDDFWDIERTRRLSVLAEVLSDRMRIGIREKRGASYSPVAFNRSSRAFAGYGLLLTYVQVDPQAAETIVAAVKEIVADLVLRGVTAEELQRAVDPILTGVKDLRRSNDYWLDSVLTGAGRHAQQIDWSRTILDDYAAVNVQELEALGAKYLQNDRAAILTLIPEPPK